MCKNIKRYINTMEKTGLFTKDIPILSISIKCWNLDM